MSDEHTPEVAPAPAAEQPVQPETPAEKSYSEAEVNAKIADAIKRRLSDYGALKEKAAKLDQLEAEQMSATEKLAKERDEALAKVADFEARTKAAELSALRVKVGSAKGLPAAYIDRLIGEDEESIAADADKLLAAMPKVDPSVPAAVHDVVAADPKDKDPFLKGLLGATK